MRCSASPSSHVTSRCVLCGGDGEKCRRKTVVVGLDAENNSTHTRHHSIKDGRKKNLQSISNPSRARNIKRAEIFWYFCTIREFILSWSSSLLRHIHYCPHRGGGFLEQWEMIINGILREFVWNFCVFSRLSSFLNRSNARARELKGRSIKSRIPKHFFFVFKHQNELEIVTRASNWLSMYTLVCSIIQFWFFSTITCSFEPEHFAFEISRDKWPMWW